MPRKPTEKLGLTLPDDEDSSRKELLGAEKQSVESLRTLSGAAAAAAAPQPVRSGSGSAAKLACPAAAPATAAAAALATPAEAGTPAASSAAGAGGFSSSRQLRPPPKNYLSSDAKVTLTTRVSVVKNITCSSTSSGGEYAMVELASPSSAASSDLESNDGARASDAAPMPSAPRPFRAAAQRGPEEAEEAGCRDGADGSRRPRERHRNRRSRSRRSQSRTKSRKAGTVPATVQIYTDDYETLMIPGWSKDLVITPPATDLGSRTTGLSSKVALEKLLGVAEDVLQKFKKVSDRKYESLVEYVRHPLFLLHVLVIVLLLSFYVYGSMASSPYQKRYTGTLAEATILLVLLGLNAWLFARERALAVHEIADRAKTVIGSLEKAGMGVVQDIRIPTVPSVTVGKVLRDNVIRTLPAVLLVEGDVVEMSYGDSAPCRMKYAYVTPPPCPGSLASEAGLERSQSPSQPADERAGASPITPELKLNDESCFAFEESAPDDAEARGGRRPGHPQSDPRPQVFLDANEVFTPAAFGVPPFPPCLNRELIQNRGRFQFILLETPLRASLKASLAYPGPRPRSTIKNQAVVLFRFVLSRCLPFVGFLALLINGLRLIPMYGRTSASPIVLILQAFEVIVIQVIYAVVTVLPTATALGTAWFIAKTYGHAVILVLFEALQGSNTEFEDEESVDEFDAEAPPPTKNLHLDLGRILGRFWYLLTKWDNTSLTCSTNLVDSLGNTTVICCFDREGTISSPFPSLEQVVLPTDHVDEPIAVLDVFEDPLGPNGVRFEDRDWGGHMSCLKPLGLNLLLNANCGVLQGRKRVEMHRRHSRLNLHGKTDAGRQACQCRLGREIGFTDEALKSFQKRKEVFTFAPYLHMATHLDGGSPSSSADSASLPSEADSVCSNECYSSSASQAARAGFRSSARRDDYHFEVPSMLSSLYEETNTGTYQLLTDGNVELVLGFCEDVWDGVGLRELDINTYKRIFDFYQNAVTNDMQCVAYAYRPINIQNGEPIPFFKQDRSSPFSSVYGSNSNLDGSGAHSSGNGRDPGVSGSHHRPGEASKSLLGVGNARSGEDGFAYIELPPGARRWWGPGIGIGDGAENRKNVYWRSESRGNVMSGEEVAETRRGGGGGAAAAGPAHPGHRARLHQTTEPAKADAFDAAGRSSPASLKSATSEEVPISASAHGRKDENDPHAAGGAAASDAGSFYEYDRERVTNDEFSFDGLELTQEVEAGFYRDVLEGEIFLGMTALCYQPKVNVCDFIEDCGVAGIRFVYFSPGSERESKAYAERLGLETDWNTCILLSRADDPKRNGPGYVEEHDIKARLPRGIENIRAHLETVDDIPLHVSLFAECSPAATQEMIRIFQENGEVVCCLGSALNHANTAAFAQTDIAISIEPLHTRAHARKADVSSGQPPLAVGAALTSLPCALQMHSESSLFVFTQLVREARRLSNSLRMGFAFSAGCCLAIASVMLLGSAMLLPPIFQGYQILWMDCVIVPAIAISFLFTPHEPDTMLLLPLKNQDHLKDLWRFLSYWLARFFLPVVMTVVVYAISLQSFSGDRLADVMDGYCDRPWSSWNASEQSEVFYAQNCALFVLVWYFACISATFLSRTKSVLEFPPYQNRQWIAASCICISLQVAFSSIALHGEPLSLSAIPGWAVSIALLWPLVFVPVNELVKVHDRNEFTRYQKMCKLVFNTKLGMHSPV